MNANEWTPANVIALITALASAVIGIIGALRGTAAQAKADVNATQLNTMAETNQAQLKAITDRQDLHGQQLTNLAQNMIPPSMLPRMQDMPQLQQPVVSQQPAAASVQPQQLITPQDGS